LFYYNLISLSVSGLKAHLAVSSASTGRLFGFSSYLHYG
jgi:hypothetical protein